MQPSIIRTEKRSRGRPKTSPTSIHLTVPPDQLAAIDAWRETLNEPPTRPAAVRMLLDLGLEAASKAK